MKDVVDRVGPALYPAVALILAFVFTTAVGWAFKPPTPQPAPPPAPSPGPTATSLVVAGGPTAPWPALRVAYPAVGQPSPVNDATDPTWQPLPATADGPRWPVTASLTDHQICVQPPAQWALRIVTPMPAQAVPPAPTGAVCLGPWAQPAELPNVVVLDLAEASK